MTVEHIHVCRSGEVSMWVYKKLLFSAEDTAVFNCSDKVDIFYKTSRIIKGVFVCCLCVSPSS